MYSFLLKTHRGASGTSQFDLRRHRQTGFGHARGERGRPQFKAQDPVRSSKRGLSFKVEWELRDRALALGPLAQAAFRLEAQARATTTVTEPQAVAI